MGKAYVYRGKGLPPAGVMLGGGSFISTANGLANVPGELHEQFEEIAVVREGLLSGALQKEEYEMADAPVTHPAETPITQPAVEEAAELVEEVSEPDVSISRGRPGR